MPLHRGPEAQLHARSGLTFRPLIFCFVAFSLALAVPCCVIWGVTARPSSLSRTFIIDAFLWHALFLSLFMVFSFSFVSSLSMCSSKRCGGLPYFSWLAHCIVLLRKSASRPPWGALWSWRFRLPFSSPPLTSWRGPRAWACRNDSAGVARPRVVRLLLSRIPPYVWGWTGLRISRLLIVPAGLG